MSMAFRKGSAGRAAGVVAFLLLAACAGDRDPPSDPSFYRSLAAPNAALDAARAAVPCDPTRMKRPGARARAMAARNKLDHNVIRDLGELHQRRIDGDCRE